MTALPPEERPPGRPERPDPPARSDAAHPARDLPSPNDDVLELLAAVVAFQASLECHRSRRPPRGHPIRHSRWRREHEVLMLQRQMLRLRLDPLPATAFRPFPRPTI